MSPTQNTSADERDDASPGDRSRRLLQRYRELRSNVAARLDATHGFEHEVSCLIAAAVPNFSTWCVIDLLDPDGTLRRLSTPDSPSYEHHESHASSVEERVPTLGTIVQQALNNPEPTIFPVARADELPYCLAVGLRVNDHSFGVLTCVADEDTPGFSPADVNAVQELSLLFSSAIERSMMQRETRNAMRHTQRIASQLHQLIATSIAVAGLRGEHDVLRRFAQSARNVFDADRVLLSLERGPLAPLLATAERGQAAVSVRPNVVAVFDELHRSRTDDFALWSDDHWCIAPLLVDRAQSRGNIAVVRLGETGFSDEDREVLTLLAQMASTALGALELSRSVQRSEARWRVLVETAPVGIIEVDLEGSIRWWNRAAAKIFAWSDFTESQELALPSLPESVRGRLLDLWSEALRGTLEGSHDLPDVTINGRQRHLTASAAPLPSTGTETRSLLTLINDVTNQRELKQELRHAHQMELRGQVASSIAHDFNNLLTLISGYAEILSHDLGDDQREMEMVHNIQSTASRASQLTAQLQAIGRFQVNESVVLDPVDLIRSSAEVLERIVGSNVMLELSLDGGVGNIKVDADQFEQMVLNLTINARDAMPNGGRLEISARDVFLDPTQGEEMNLPEGRYAMFAIADTGEGMDEETQQRCFEPLFTTKGPFNGTGMGLAAARRLVEESGGAIHFTSAPKLGTTFRIYFPTVLEEISELTIPEVVNRPRGTASVLLAEDDESLRKLIVQVLRRNGYEVTDTGSGEAALERARRGDTSFDVLVSDVVMGELSGPELASQLYESQPSLRVLLLSGTADSTVLDALPAGTSRFLAKPFKPSQLIDEVHALLETRDSAS
jgi:PAS domain S-box-containing protein